MDNFLHPNYIEKNIIPKLRPVEVEKSSKISSKTLAKELTSTSKTFCHEWKSFFNVFDSKV
jgi:hypothetical protein